MIYKNSFTLLKSLYGQNSMITVTWSDGTKNSYLHDPIYDLFDNMSKRPNSKRASFRETGNWNDAHHIPSDIQLGASDYIIYHPGIHISS